MIFFDFNGIIIESFVERRRIGCRGIEDDKYKILIERQVKVIVKFWEYTIVDGDLYSLAFIKSCLQLFIQLYWRRSKKSESRLDLGRHLMQFSFENKQQFICFRARQKNKEHSLEIFYMDSPDKTHSIYLNPQEVILLEIAISKAINLLAPASRETDEVFDL